MIETREDDQHSATSTLLIRNGQLRSYQPTTVGYHDEVHTHDMHDTGTFHMHGSRLEQSVATTYKQLALGTVYGNARSCLVSYCNRLLRHAKCYTMDNYVSRSTFSINSIKSLSNCVDTLIEIGRHCWMV